MSTVVGRAAGPLVRRSPLRRLRPGSARLAGSEDARSRLASLGAFAALAGFCAGHWSALVAEPPTFRVMAVVAIATGAGAALTAIGGRPRSRASTAARAGTLVAALAAALVTIGAPARLLLPGGLDELAGGLSRGLAGLHTVDWPYAGPDGWVRLAILLAVPATLCMASALAFWPTGRHRARLRAAALVSLVALYGTAVAQQDPGEPLVRGAVLLALLAAWLFGSAIGGRTAPVATAMVLVAAAAALPLAARLPAGEPLVDYGSWRWFGEPAAFTWDHSYGPIDWPREGKTVLTIESERPHYWKTVALDRFDGFRWERSEVAASSSPDPAAPTTNPPRWETEVAVTVESLHSELLVSQGSIRQVEGAGVATLTRDGAAHASEELDQGSTYTVRAYAPNPTAERLRRTLELDPTVVRPYTRIHLPPDDASSEPGPGVVLPRFSDGRGGTAGAERAVLSSPYAGVYELAQRLVEGAPTAYDAVRRIEAHLREEYLYSEQPPAREHPLAAFLLQDRIGYCQQFSGAMALMLRMNGIPARVATGFSPGVRDRSTDEFTVRDLDAHSWVEAHFAGIGWVPFDPTPPAAPAASRADETLASAARGNLGLAGLGLAGPSEAEQPPAQAPTGAGPAGPAEAERDTGGRQSPGVAGVAAVAMAALVLLALAGAFLVWRRAEQGPDAPVAELRRALERLGHPLAPGATLADVERRLREAGRTDAARHVRRMSGRRFAGPGRPPPDARGRRALRAALTAGSNPLARARGYALLPPRLGAAGGRTPWRRRARLAAGRESPV